LILQILSFYAKTMKETAAIPPLPLTPFHSHAIMILQQQMVQETVPLLLIFMKEALL